MSGVGGFRGRDHRCDKILCSNSTAGGAHLLPITIQSLLLFNSIGSWLVLYIFLYNLKNYNENGSIITDEKLREPGVEPPTLATAAYYDCPTDSSTSHPNKQYVEAFHTVCMIVITYSHTYFTPASYFLKDGVRDPTVEVLSLLLCLTGKN